MTVDHKNGRRIHHVKICLCAFKISSSYGWNVHPKLMVKVWHFVSFLVMWQFIYVSDESIFNPAHIYTWVSTTELSENNCQIKYALGLCQRSVSTTQMSSSV